MVERGRKGRMAMTSDMDLVRRVTEEGYVKGELDVLEESFAADFVDHDPPPGYPPTRDGVLQAAEMVVTAFSNRRIEFDDYLEATDGRIIESWAMRATHTGEALGLPASGSDVRVRGVDIYRCADGQIVEHWGAVDMSDFLEKAQAASA
jgi:predicted ester cyclase